MLVKSLKSSEGPLLESVLSTLYSLVQEDKSSIEPHAGMLLDHFLELASFPSYVPVRIKVLKWRLFILLYLLFHIYFKSFYFRPAVALGL